MREKMRKKCDESIEKQKKYEKRENKLKIDGTAKISMGRLKSIGRLKVDGTAKSRWDG